MLKKIMNFPHKLHISCFVALFDRYNQNTDFFLIVFFFYYAVDDIDITVN